MTTNQLIVFRHAKSGRPAAYFDAATNIGIVRWSIGIGDSGGFAMAGAIFLQAQYLQFILGYTPLAAGFALIPAALGVMLGTGAGAHMSSVVGGRAAVIAGTVLAAAGMAVQATFTNGTSYLPTGIGLFLFGIGAGIAMPTATELIMSTLPPARTSRA